MSNKNFTTRKSLIHLDAKVRKNGYIHKCVIAILFHG